MPALVQICVVIVTIATVVIAALMTAVAIRIMRMSGAVHESLAEIRRFVDETRGVTVELRQVLTRLDDIGDAARSVAGQAEGLATRAASMTSALLDELEQPLRNTAALVRGVRAGTGVLLKRLSRREHANDSPGNLSRRT